MQYTHTNTIFQLRCARCFYWFQLRLTNKINLIATKLLFFICFITSILYSLFIIHLFNTAKIWLYSFFLTYFFIRVSMFAIYFEPTISFSFLYFILFSSPFHLVSSISTEKEEYSVSYWQSVGIELIKTLKFNREKESEADENAIVVNA